MPQSSKDDSLLLIRCPSCAQRFKVEDSLVGRTVECGGCEHRFKITDDVIVRGKKFYPGERRNASLERFQRVPTLAGAFTPPTLDEIQYALPPSANSIEPTPPVRVFAGIVAVVGMIFTGLLLMFAHNPGGVLDGVTREHRLILAGFVGTVGTAMLIYANPRTRLQAFLTSIIMVSGLMILPFVFTQGSIPLESRIKTQDDARPAPNHLTPKEQEIEDLRTRIGTKPLEEEILRLQSQGDPRKAYGLWLRNLREQNRYMVRDYLLRITGADPMSHFYPRDRSDFLMVLTGTHESLEEIAKITSKIGEVVNSYPDLGVIEIRVINQNFIEPPADQLDDQNSKDFYSLNLRELDSIDIQRVLRAVRRLATSEPKILRDDISQALIRLLKAPGELEFKLETSRALDVWSNNRKEFGSLLLETTRDLLAKEVLVPHEMMQILAKLKPEGLAQLLEEMWSRNPMDWETLLGDLGPTAEPLILSRFSKLDDHTRRSAIRLLGRVGGHASIETLNSAIANADPEMKILIDSSLDSIQKRNATAPSDGDSSPRPSP